MSEDFVYGYLDGIDPTSPDPGPNRSEAYKHSFKVARAEAAGVPIPAHVSRARATVIRARSKLDPEQ